MQGVKSDVYSVEHDFKSEKFPTETMMEKMKPEFTGKSYFEYRDKHLSFALFGAFKP